jgi:hypothetical protein
MTGRIVEVVNVTHSNISVSAEPRCFTTGRGVELCSYPPDELGRTPFGRQRSAQKEQGPNLHRFRIRSNGSGGAGR